MNDHVLAGNKRIYLQIIMGNEDLLIHWDRTYKCTNFYAQSLQKNTVSIVELGAAIVYIVVKQLIVHILDIKVKVCLNSLNTTCIDTCLDRNQTTCS